jgi:hypothetical protein
MSAKKVTSIFQMLNTIPEMIPIGIRINASVLSSFFFAMGGLVKDGLIVA